MSRIVEIRGREIMDSRGNPTVEADVMLASGAQGRAAVPSGASTGTREAVELRDGDPKRYGGKGVLKAVEHINTVLRKALLGRDARDQEGLDQVMIDLDGTETKGRLGANALLAISLANAHAAAAFEKLPLFKLCRPGPRAGHAGAHDEHHQRRRACQQQPGYPGVHDPPGRRADLSRGAALWRGDLPCAEEDPEPIGASRPRWAMRAASRRTSSPTRRRWRSSCRPSTRPATRRASDIYLGLDAASSEFYKDGRYELECENRRFTATEFTRYLADLAARYPIITIEDGMSEADWAGWAELTRALGERIQLVGDDLFVTNTKILAEGIAKGTANAILIKPNQIGTLTETLAAISHGRTGRLRLGDVASLWGDRGCHHRRSGGGAPRPRRSRPVHCRARTAPPSTTSCCASSWRLGKVRYAGRDAFPVKL